MNGPDYAARAAAGAAFLDEKVPGWADRIDLGRLEMDSCLRCVLGQLGGSYRDAAEDFGIDGDSEVGLGFLPLAAESKDAGELLNAAWTAEISKRRGPAQVTPLCGPTLRPGTPGPRPPTRCG